MGKHMNKQKTPKSSEYVKRFNCNSSQESIN